MKNVYSKKNIVTGGDYGDKKLKFVITDTTCYVPVVILSYQDNEALLERFKTEHI